MPDLIEAIDDRYHQEASGHGKIDLMPAVLTAAGVTIQELEIDTWASLTAAIDDVRVRASKVISLFANFVQLTNPQDTALHEKLADPASHTGEYKRLQAGYIPLSIAGKTGKQMRDRIGFYPSGELGNSAFVRLTPSAEGRLQQRSLKPIEARVILRGRNFDNPETSVTPVRRIAEILQPIHEGLIQMDTLLDLLLPVAKPKDQFQSPNNS